MIMLVNVLINILGKYTLYVLHMFICFRIVKFAHEHLVMLLRENIEIQFQTTKFLYQEII